MQMTIFGESVVKYGDARGCSEVGYRASLSRRKSGVRVPSASQVETVSKRVRF